MSMINRPKIPKFSCPNYPFFSSYYYLFASSLLILRVPNQVLSLSFTYPDFSNTQNLNFSGDAFSSNGTLSLTKNQADANLTGSVGRVVYSKEFHLWDHASGRVSDFSTHFSFTISMLKTPIGGDGLTLFLTPNGSHIPDMSRGSCLGLISKCETFSLEGNPVVAVEIDTFKNFFDPSDNHIGIDINSIRSVTNITWSTKINNGSLGHVWFSYTHENKTLRVYFTFLENPVDDGESTLSHGIDITEVLPEWVTVGFSASTGAAIELHLIRSWEFHSTEFTSKNSSSVCLRFSHKCWAGWLIVVGAVAVIIVIVGGYRKLRGESVCRKDDIKILCCCGKALLCLAQCQHGS